MSEAIRQESPLVERITPERKAASPADAGVTLRERPFLGCVNLRGNPEDASFTDAVQGVLGVALPTEPNTVVESGDITVFWLAPTEWFVRTVADGERDLIARLEEALAGQHIATNDVTGNFTTIELAGPHARDVLEKGCTLDLHPRAFAPGQCAQTLLSHAGILIRPVHDGQAFELVVRRSFADYTFIWLEDAAVEYGGVAISD
ncbi:MAG: sarcosine oxidase subunit gamma family protein [Halofilum sp. (in: g-proteobacteria)]|nr:sarcosine oxidase subunit gamma family protein [Halofilum sp. (in: g-proteobacteria)]